MDWSADRRPSAPGAIAPGGAGAAVEASVTGWANAFRIELRVQAIELASRGWSVLPGTYPTGYEAGAPAWSESGIERSNGTSHPVPVHADWQDRLGAGVRQVADWWAEQPYSLLVATGDQVEALETGAELGRRAARALRALGAPAPIVATPDARWYFLAQGGSASAVCPELIAAGAVRRHSTGSWLPVPPSTFHHGVVHWRVKPEVCGWRLPSPEIIGEALRAGADAVPDVAELVVAGN
ncbi:bifunctional DNA primase/polymerase [Saccharopolyspora sp. MS10]|uniref:bifunctional DNA primase/polymerase n=1 Tax=Saccharopolyspora sp. MS10 TaxID=3385973 RepID=UPI0039A0FA33